MCSRPHTDDTCCCGRVRDEPFPSLWSHGMLLCFCADCGFCATFAPASPPAQPAYCFEAEMHLRAYRMQAAPPVGPPCIGCQRFKFLASCYTVGVCTTQVLLDCDLLAQGFPTLHGIIDRIRCSGSDSLTKLRSFLKTCNIPLCTGDGFGLRHVFCNHAKPCQYCDTLMASMPKLDASKRQVLMSFTEAHHGFTQARSTLETSTAVLTTLGKTNNQHLSGIELRHKLNALTSKVYLARQVC